MCWRRAVLGFGCLLVVSCDGPTGPQLVGPAMLRVTVSTAGPDPDPDGYLVIVDGLQLATIGLSDQWIDSTLHVGSHSVLLGGTAANCTVTSPNPVPIYVKAHTLATATFAVQCVSTHIGRQHDGGRAISHLCDAPAPAHNHRYHGWAGRSERLHRLRRSTV